MKSHSLQIIPKDTRVSSELLASGKKAYLQSNLILYRASVLSGEAAVREVAAYFLGNINCVIRERISLLFR